MVLQVSKENIFIACLQVRKIFSLPARAPYTSLACLCEPRHDKTKASIQYDKMMNAYMYLLR